MTFPKCLTCSSGRQELQPQWQLCSEGKNGKIFTMQTYIHLYLLDLSSCSTQWILCEFYFSCTSTPLTNEVFMSERGLRIVINDSEALDNKECGRTVQILKKSF